MLKKIASTALVALLATTSATFAASIGVNFVNEYSTSDSTLASNDEAGLIKQDNWNNVDVLTRDGSTGALNDDSGSATGVNLSWSKVNNSFYGASTSASPDEKLFRGMIEGDYNGTGPLGPLLSISGVGYATYDVYVYMADFASTPANVTVDGVTKYYTGTNDFATNGFVEATSTSTSSQPLATYALFSGLTGSDFTITFDKTPVSGFSNRATTVGFQIVEAAPVPLPAALPMLVAAVGGLGMLRRRKRAA